MVTTRTSSTGCPDVMLVGAGITRATFCNGYRHSVPFELILAASGRGW